jgi:hypothetical protein
VWRGNSLVLEEYQIGSTTFDNVRFGDYGDLSALQGFKWDYSGAIAGGSESVGRKLVEQAMTQLQIADELGVPLEWHVADTQLQGMQNVLGPELSSKITWVTYSLSGVRRAWGL